MADRAHRQYDAVDPLHRLVAAELEARWNAALARVREAEVRLQSELESLGSFTEEQRRRLLALSSDLPAAWNHPAAPVELKKRILRTVLKEIVVDVNHGTANIELQIHWAGGVHTALKVRKNRPGRNGQATEQNVVALVRELAQVQPDASIAATLNRLGCRTGSGNSWTQTRVKNLRQSHRIAGFVKGADRPWITMDEAAAELQVGVGVVRTMIKQRLLPARQMAKHAPWMISRPDLQRAEVQHYTQTARAGKPAPREDENQTTMPYL